MAGQFYILVCASGLLLCLGTAFYWLQRYGTAALAIQPVVLFSIYFAIIHFGMPIYKYTIQMYRYPYEYSEVSMLYNATVCLFVYLALILLVRNPGFRHQSMPKKAQNGAIVAVWSGGVLTFASMIVMFVLRQRVAAVGYDAFLTDRILITNQLGFFAKFDTIVLPGVGLLLAGLLNIKKRLLIGWAFLAVATAYAGSYFSMMQSRNSIILMVLILISTFSFYRSYEMKISGRGLIIWLMSSGLLVAVIVAGYATSVSRYAGLENEYAKAALENIIFISLDGPFGNDENLLWLIEYNHPYLWGKTYLAGLANIVPRGVWPDKPWGAGPEIRNFIYPGSYILGAEGNTSLTTGLLTEARMNFGFFGIVIVGAIWVATVRKIIHSLTRYTTVSAQAIYILLLVFMTTATLYSEFLGMFGRFFVCLITAMAVHILIKSILAISRAGYRYS